MIVGNWKMNGLRAALSEISALGEALSKGTAPVRLGICPPATLLSSVSALAAPLGIATGGQDCHVAVSGAHTGDISAQMLADAGASLVILGHSERRADHGETDALVAAKVAAALDAGLLPIVCVGETRDQRDAGQALPVVATQLAGSLPEACIGREVVIAYEPVWAIGTGLTPTSQDIEEMHGAIRTHLVERFGPAGAVTPILYGGSLKPANAREILHLSNVNGGLVGGASLLAKDLGAIISAL